MRWTSKRTGGSQLTPSSFLPPRYRVHRPPDIFRGRDYIALGPAADSRRMRNAGVVGRAGAPVQEQGRGCLRVTGVEPLMGVRRLRPRLLSEIRGGCPNPAGAHGE